MKDFDLIPISFKAPEIKALETCSPVESKTSSSLLVKLFETNFDSDINSFVFPAIAETTTIILLPISDSFLMIFAACFILSIEPTDVPPNFKTFFFIIKF